MILDYAIAILATVGVFSIVNALGDGRLWNLSAREEFIKGVISLAAAGLIYWLVVVR